MSIRVPVTLLVLTHLGVCGLLAVVGCWFPAASEGAFETLLPVILSQPILVALWIVYGGRPTPWRLVAVVGLFAAGMLLGESVPAGGLAAREFVHAILPPLFVSNLLCVTLLAGLRLLGLTVARPSSKSESTQSGTRFQFTLSAMLLWVVAAAVSLGVLSFTVRRLDFDSLWLQAMALAFPPGFMTVIGVYCLWIALSNGHRETRLLVILLCPLAALFLGSTGEGLTYQICGTMTCIIYSLLVFRGAGIRMTWRPRKIPSDEGDTSSHVSL